MKTTLGGLLAVCCSLAVVAICRGEALPETGNATSPADDAARFIEQLDAPEFARRQEASRRLTEAGKTAFSQLELAAQAGSREVASRAVEILRSHFQGGDEQTKLAAKAALERLAKSSNPSAAQRAADALNPRPEPSLAAANVNGINPAMIQLMQQRAIQQQAIQQQLRIPVAAPGVRRAGRGTNIRSVNGQLEVEVFDGDKIIKVKDVPGGLEAEARQTVNGKPTTRKIAANNLDDLRNKDADAARAYEDAVKQQIENYDRMIQDYKIRRANFPNLQRSIDSLEQTKQQFEQRLKAADNSPGRSKPAPVPAPAADDPFALPAAAPAPASPAPAAQARQLRDPFAP